MGEQERLYAMALARICRFNFAAAQAIYRAMGSATAAYDNRVDIARLAGGCPTRMLKELGNWDTALLRAEAEMEFAARHSVRVLTPAASTNAPTRHWPSTTAARPTSTAPG